MESKNLMDSLTIDERAALKAMELGWRFLTYTKLTHPDDNYLIYTVVERRNKYTPSGKDYATHLFNGSTNTFAYGHYDIVSYSDAVEDMERRVK